MRQLFRDCFEEIVKGKILAGIIHCWTCASLPYIDHQIAEIMDNENWIDLRSMVKDMRRDKSPKMWVYRDSFWEEKVLSRFRAAVQPTKVWAKRVDLEWLDKCRHCRVEADILEHLIFDKCSSLQFQFNLEQRFAIKSVQQLTEALKNEHGGNRVLLEDHLIDITRQNELFARRVYDVP